MEFIDYLKQEKEITNKALELFFNKKKSVAGEIDQELVFLTERVAEQFLRGGKRIRPLLTRLAYQMGGGDASRQIVEASLFVELMHSYLLVHDDIADGDLKRRGQPTLEVEFGELLRKQFGKKSPRFAYSSAMIAGDLLMTLAQEALFESDFGSQEKAAAELEMTKTLKEVVSGWYIHQLQNHENLNKARKERYLEGMKLVSGSYTFIGPLMVGLALAGGDRRSWETGLRNYGEHAGIAFQIQDDILGVFGKSSQTGKPVGNDLREGKKTLLVLQAYQETDEFGKKFLEESIGQDLSEEELDEVQNIIREAGALDYASELAVKEVAAAKQALNGLETQDNEAVKRLGELAEFAVSRTY